MPAPVGRRSLDDDATHQQLPSLMGGLRSRGTLEPIDSVLQRPADKLNSPVDVTATATSADGGKVRKKKGKKSKKETTEDDSYKLVENAQNEHPESSSEQ